MRDNEPIATDKITSANVLREEIGPLTWLFGKMSLAMHQAIIIYLLIHAIAVCNERFVVTQIATTSKLPELGLRGEEKPANFPFGQLIWLFLHTPLIYLHFRWLRGGKFEPNLPNTTFCILQQKNYTAWHNIIKLGASGCKRRHMTGGIWGKWEFIQGAPRQTTRRGWNM